MSSTGKLTAWLARGGTAVREDARRALAELVEGGDLRAEEARALEEAVSAAIDRSADFLSEHVVTPLQELLLATRGPAPELEGLADRLDALTERLDRLEARLASEDDAPCS